MSDNKKPNIGAIDQAAEMVVQNLIPYYVRCFDKAVHLGMTRAEALRLTIAIIKAQK
jgi:hypothetical protein